jgi:hypothetical protein
MLGKKEMKRIEIFDQAVCCSTGLSSANIDWLLFYGII